VRPEAVDVAIEFTRGTCAAEVIGTLVDQGVATASGTTGWTVERDAWQQRVQRGAAALLLAPNFSLGAALTLRTVTALAQAAAPLGRFAPYLIEEHHAAKRDAPSGTARALAERLVAAFPAKQRYGPAPDDGPIPAELVPVAWVRAGEIPGTHRIGFDAAFETIEVVHRVRDRHVFAIGALTAAEWLCGRRGLFSLDDVLRAGSAEKGT
jgi:4-hydroxy-tetrahydrodipicolinate reductase